MTQDNAKEKRRKNMAFMDDQRKNAIMTVTELKRFNFVLAPAYTGGAASVMRVIDPKGEYVRFADVEAYAQAAIAAAMMGAGREIDARYASGDMGNPSHWMSIPTDALASLEAVKAKVRDEAFSVAQSVIDKMAGNAVQRMQDAEFAEPTDGAKIWSTVADELQDISAAIRALKGGA